MKQCSNVSTIDIPCASPFVPGFYRLGGDDLLWDRMHNLSTNNVLANTDIVNLKFLSKERRSHVVSVALNDDLHLVINDSLWASDKFRVCYQGNDRCMLSFRLSGGCTEKLDHNSYHLGAFSCSLFNMPAGVDYSFEIPSGEILTEVCIIFKASWLERKFRFDADVVKRILQPAVGRSSDPWFSQCNMTPAIEKIVNDLCAIPLTVPTYRLYSEAKVIELIALYLTQLCTQTCDSQKARNSTQKDIEKLQNLKVYLSANFREPPSLDALCRMSGLNRKKITEGFKFQFGKTIFEYVQYLRIEKAKQLLRDNPVSVSFVAEQVGYGYPGNFTKAFKEQVGLSPKQFSVSRIEW